MTSVRETTNSDINSCVVCTNLLVEEGLDYILNHFEKPIWPRTVSTSTTKQGQVLVFNKEEALTMFKQSNFFDCRMSAYPGYSEYKGINRQSPNLIMIDFDLEHFSSKEALDRAIKTTLRKIRELFPGIEPTIIWTGNGVHIYLPVDSPVLEQIEQFNKFDQPSKLFLRFAESNLSNGKSDAAHNATVSTKNSMLRIPGSLNSKCILRSAEVKVINRWNGYRPKINSLLGSFRACLIDQEIRELKTQEKKRKSAPNDQSSIQWIEKLLHTPISDGRKFAVWRILAPYLINVRKISPQESFSIIADWLDKCNMLEQLTFNAKLRIKEGLRGASKGYLPISFEKLRTENSDLYKLAKQSS